MNIFNNTGIFYFQVPSHVLESSVWAELKPASQSLYIYLLFRAQHDSTPFVTLTAKQLKDGAGLSAVSVSVARKELTDKRLVWPTDKQKEGCQYEILDPATGLPIGKVQDFNALSPELLEAYFMHHLHGHSPKRTEEGMRFVCPFHDGNGKSDQALAVKLSDGGPWSCGGWKGCKKRGKLVAFEMAMAAKHGKTITQTEAHHQIQQILVQAAGQKRLKEEAELTSARALLGAPAPHEWGQFDPA